MKNIREILYKVSNNTRVVEANIGNDKIGISELIAIIHNRWSLTIKQKVKLLEEIYPYGNKQEKGKITRVIKYYNNALNYIIPIGYSGLLKLEENKYYIFTDIDKAIKKAILYKKKYEDVEDFSISIIKNNSLDNCIAYFCYDYKGNMKKIYFYNIPTGLNNILNTYADVKAPYKNNDPVYINDLYNDNKHGFFYNNPLSEEDKKEFDLDYFDSTGIVIFYNNDHDHADLFDIYRKEVN